ncbi:hypothetical protein JYU34_003656 [Plutella xylostella]|uniref:Uncharacterized protein n=1 Tax=Plutella xylostella TaxID=51655 RepID=A0ABQ7R0L9_PLUXY|nr:hypothetical protein JYU34_003656 [Plutella xylostella]
MLKYLIFLNVMALLVAKPIVLKGTSDDGQTLIAVSASDPEIGRQLFKNFNQHPGNGQGRGNLKPENYFEKLFSFAVPGSASAGGGRAFVSASSFNPFLFPLFHYPINVEGYGLSNADHSSLFKGLEGHYDGNLAGNGQSVTTVNDGGHIYGKINTVTFDNHRKSNLGN